MNKQPFYHRAVVLFTATEELSMLQVEALLHEKLKGRPLVPGSVALEELEIEPGDPADLC